jgi:hypothetical protein
MSGLPNGFGALDNSGALPTGSNLEPGFQLIITVTVTREKVERGWCFFASLALNYFPLLEWAMNRCGQPTTANKSRNKHHNSAPPD